MTLISTFALTSGLLFSLATMCASQTIDPRFDWRSKSNLDEVVAAVRSQHEELKKIETDIVGLNHAQRLAYIGKLPLGAYAPVPEFWQTVCNLDTCIDAMYFTKEPLNKLQLTALSRCVQGDPGSDSYIMGAALLYRYCVPLGSHILRNHLSKFYEPDIGIIFASNGDYSMLKEMIRDLRTGLVVDPNLLLALKDCRSPDLTNAIYELFEEHSDDPDLVAAIAVHNISKALPILSLRYKTSPGNGLIKYSLAGALVKLDFAHQQDANDFLTQGFISHDPIDTWCVATAVTATNNSSFAPSFEAILKRYIASTSQERQSVRPSAIDYSIAQLSVVALISFGDRSSIPIVDGFLNAQDPEYITGYSTADIAKLVLGMESDDVAVRKRFGVHWTATELKKLSLRRLPRNFLLDEVEVLPPQLYLAGPDN